MLAHSGLEDCEQGFLLMEVSNHFQRFAGIASTIAPIPMNNVASSLPHRAGLVPMPCGEGGTVWSFDLAQPDIKRYLVRVMPHARMILLVVEQSWAHHMSIVGVHAFHLLADDALVNSCNVRLRIWQERCIEGDTCAFVRSVMTVPVKDYVSANACMVISRVEQKRTYHSVSAIPFKGLFFLYFSPQWPALSRPSLSLLPSYGMTIAKEFVTKLTEKMHQGSVTTYSSEVPVALELNVLLEAEIAVA